MNSETKTTDRYVITTGWTDCNYCGGTGVNPEDWRKLPPNAPCQSCEGKKGYRWVSKHERYKCVGGPKDGERATEPEVETDYVRYNCGKFGQRWSKDKFPKCMLIHKSLLEVAV